MIDKMHYIPTAETVSSDPEHWEQFAHGVANIAHHITQQATEFIDLVHEPVGSSCCINYMNMLESVEQLQRIFKDVVRSHDDPKAKTQRILKELEVYASRHRNA